MFYRKLFRGKKSRYKNLVIESQEKEELLIASESRYRRLFESAKDGILILDAETGMIVDVNPFLIHLLGYSKDQFVRRAIWDIGVFHDIVANHDKFRELQDKEYVRYEDLPLKTATGRAVHVEFVSNVYLENGKRVIQCNIRDITRRKVAEDALNEAKKESDRLKTAFLNNVSHEIRTPLNAIVGFCNFLRDSDIEPEKRLRYIQIINQSSNQLLTIISDIVNIATIETGHIQVNKKEFNLNRALQLLHAQFIPLAQDQKTCLILEPTYSIDDFCLISDERKLVLILSNLLNNAIKFTQEGLVRFGYTFRDEDLELFVEDTGIGIPREMQENIFNRFNQGDSLSMSGTGLGLSISKSYVELLGGSIRLVSEMSIGTTFYVLLPKAVLSEHETIKHPTQHHTPCYSS